MDNLQIPLSVAPGKRDEYRQNWQLATAGTGRLFLFAGDQKVEHLNDDFFGSGIAPDDAQPEHLFQIAADSPGVVLATQLGLLARYGQDYPDLPYIVKINGKTDLHPNKDIVQSRAWYQVADVINFKKQSRLNIVGIGYTIYLGSQHESKMLTEAAQIINQAHQAGLLAIIWAYTRNATLKNEQDPHLIAGAAGVAACLGADFAKVNYPYQAKNPKKAALDFKEAVKAAGRTKLICVGGAYKNSGQYLKHLENQIKISQTGGVAIGRNIHQRPLKEAADFTKAVKSIVHHDYSATEAEKVLKGKKILPKSKTKEFSFFSFF